MINCPIFDLRSHLEAWDLKIFSYLEEERDWKNEILVEICFSSAYIQKAGVPEVCNPEVQTPQILRKKIGWECENYPVCTVCMVNTVISPKLCSFID